MPVATGCETMQRLCGSPPLPDPHGHVRALYQRLAARLCNSRRFELGIGLRSAAGELHNKCLRTVRPHAQG
jgi:hypothetical protein